MCECLRARFHITVSATVNCMQPSPVRAIHSDFAARIPRQRYNGHWKLEKPLFLLHARCSYVSSLSLHSRHPLKGNRELSRIWREGERERKRWNREGRSEKVKSLLFLCPAPVARPLLPPTSQACSLRKAEQEVQKRRVCSCMRLFAFGGSSVYAYMSFGDGLIWVFCRVSVCSVAPWSSLETTSLWCKEKD